MTIQTAEQSTAIVSGGHKLDSMQIQQARELTYRLRYMIVNGNKLSDHEVIALAQYAVATDLNPFAGECYFLPGTGPVPGIAGWRKKAQEQLEYEARAAGLQIAPYFTVDYFDATTQEAVFNPATDLGYRAVIKDSVSQKQWSDSLFAMMRELRSAGVQDAYKEAINIIGPQPTWSGVGVVFGSENFGRIEKFDRRERAKKRAEHAALKKRFPRVQLPEPQEMDYEETQFKVMTDVEYKESLPEPKQVKSIDQLNVELGFDPEPEHTPTPLTDAVKASADAIPAESAPTTRPFHPEDLKEVIGNNVKNFVKHPEKMEGFKDTWRGMIVSTIEKELADMVDDKTTARQTILRFLVGHDHSNEMSKEEVQAIWKWLGVAKVAEVWTTNTLSVEEIKAMVNYLADQPQEAE